MKDVVALGELLIDFIPVSSDKNGYPTLKAQPGGAPANFLTALGKYGASTALIGKVGDDAFGHLLIDTMKQSDVETKGIVMDAKVFTTMAFVTLDASGNRSFSFARKPGVDQCIKESEIDWKLLEECRVFHFGSLSLTSEPSRTATKAAVAFAKSNGKLISFDPNLRKPLWENLRDAKEQMEWGLSQANIVKISDEEVDFLWGISPEQGAQKLLNGYGVDMVFVTLGAQGCYFANLNGSGTVPSPRGIHVVDTTGAGDIFGGSALSRFLLLHKSPQEITAEEMYSITRFACCAASLSTQSHGGIASVAEEAAVTALLDSYRYQCIRKGKI